MQLPALNKSNLISGTRYLARLFNVLLLFVVVALLLKSFDLHSKESSLEFVFLISFLILLLGLILAWHWEKIGGLLILIGFILLTYFNTSVNPKFNFSIFNILFPLTGILFLICCWSEQKK